MQTSFRSTIISSAALFLAGCAKPEQAAPASTPAAAAPPAPAPARAIALGDIAGKWQVRSVPESGPDTTSTSYVLTATADTTGWFVTFPTGLKVPIKVVASGDSVVERTGTFASQRRKGVKVHTEATMRMQDGKLVGTTIAHYTNAGADSVLRLRTEGTKMPK